MPSVTFRALRSDYGDCRSAVDCRRSRNHAHAIFCTLTLEAVVYRGDTAPNSNNMKRADG
jgi:hypothetical protein